jgi:hypothetical protein
MRASPQWGGEPKMSAKKNQTDEPSGFLNFGSETKAYFLKPFTFLEGAFGAAG